jgi:hypothetical protein
VATIARQWRAEVHSEVNPLPGPMLRTDGPVSALIRRREDQPRAAPSSPPGQLTIPTR